MAIEAVIFDIGNVLIEWQPERWYDARIGASRRREMFAAVDLHAMNDRVDRGEDFRAVIYATAEANPAFAPEIRMWHDHWIELAQPLIPHSLRLMEALQARAVPVFALSNFGIGTYAAATPRYPFLGRFDRAFISGHLGVTKPAPEIYRIVEAEGGVAPGRLLFTDDRAENLDVAAARGWQTHLFDRPEGLAARLVTEGLLTESEAA
jgi:2-haloacid dehalogenase